MLKVFFAIFLAAFGAAQAQLYYPDVAKYERQLWTYLLSFCAALRSVKTLPPWPQHRSLACPPRLAGAELLWRWD